MKNFFNALDKLAIKKFKKKTKTTKKPSKPVFICVHLMEGINVKLWKFTKE